MSEAAATKEKEVTTAKKGLSGKLKIGILLALVVAAQCVLAWLLLPSGETAESAETKHEVKSGAVAFDPAAEDPHAERREVDLH